MANTDTPKGLVPVKNRNGSAWDGQINPYYIPVTEATVLFAGDPMVKTGTANTAAFEEFAAGMLPAVTIHTVATTNPITGVIVGFGVDPNQLERTYNPTLTERVVWLADDPNVVFEAQCSAGFAATDVGGNALVTLATAGSTVTGLSGAEVDSTTFAVTATHSLKVLRLVNAEDNALGTNAKVEVTINNHTDANATAGI